MALFCDSEFPPEVALRGVEGVQARRWEWVAASKLNRGDHASRNKRMPLFWRIDANDLAQGSVANCWWMAAVASLASYPLEVEALFAGSSHASGMYRVKLHDANGQAQHVVVDEYVPTYPAGASIAGWEHLQHVPLFAKPNGEMWPLLLEKAMAKLMGSYGAMAGAFEGAAFRALTGSMEQEIWLRNLRRSPSTWKQYMLAEDSMTSITVAPKLTLLEPAQFWRRMRSCCDELNYLTCVSILNFGQGHEIAERVRKDGLVEGHAYSLLGFVDADTVRLVKLRNPWGRGTWNGDWSDNSPLWQANPGIAEIAGFRANHDGTFFMAFEDWSRIFNGVAVSNKVMRMGPPRSAAPPEIPTESIRSSSFRSSLNSSPVCEHGHPLRPFVVHNNSWVCDRCQQRVARGSILAGCRRCNWDICEDCLAAEAAARSQQRPSRQAVSMSTVLEEEQLRVALEISKQEAQAAGGAIGQRLQRHSGQNPVFSYASSLTEEDLLAIALLESQEMAQACGILRQASKPMQ
mmetsp:Transcript_86896/g.172508  ORF Transcript_86896/g.172508 Transcript_86896/m.172508 type:complete len:518 (-) Transcript_86896:289-1842(-)|eukprot:CAMPEP_0172843924 /NCGR_PEP_ID=MMETSP1075-20121228/31832_1 /TAXON_ID=2916 /ORGANISM="Ceratium fusus, Strain PA161109" /LENGTH=517 /DNA_ID=CAMNT_0013688267 /DNA_START=3 /DNA_END=1556 /DNA_ORIENTATION=+